MEDKNFNLYKLAIETQMHFNDLIMKIRTIVTSIITAVFGAAAIVLGESSYSVFILNRTIHISALIIIAGIFFLFAYLMLDFFYYFKLLLGAVDCTKEIEKIYPEFTITSSINKRVTTRAAYISLIVYYGIIILIGIVAFLFIIIKVKK